ncbi:hypothetical protein BH09MYX1_BH09MYX1_54560 [soil metagenome]
MLKTLSLFTAVAAVALTTTIARDAAACGGCLVPPGENTVVEGHRMALSISKTQTVLWDQFKYSGSPKEFAWVLPVRAGTKVELSHDEFFAALEASTQPVITAPPQNNGSGGSGGGFGCGSADTASSYSGGGSDPPVQVLNQEVVGPYEVVTLKATDASALQTWLASHGYVIPPAVQPVIDAYVKEQFDFVALRLLPNKDVNSMQPVRVITPGADATLPLRMVAAGVSAKVGIVLYVIGEGRYETANFPNLAIDLTGISWDYSTNRSTYNETVEAALAKGDGRGWFTELAYPMVVQRDASKISYYPNNGGGLPTLTTAYATAIQGAKCASPFPDGGTIPPIDGGSPVDSGAIDASSDGESDASEGDGGDGGGNLVDGGGDSGGDAGGTSKDCIFDDVDVATRGMFPSDVWITRLRANLPTAALSTDLKLQGSAQQTKVDALYRVAAAPAQDPGDGCHAAPGGSGPGDRSVTAMGLGALGLAAILRRRRR